MNITTTVDVGHWVAQRTGEEWFADKGSALGFMNESGELVCGFVFYDLNGRTVWCGLASVDSWASPDAFHAVADYVFRQLGCEWARCKIAASNVKSWQLVESVGFELECILEGSHPTGDERIYRMHVNKCAWLDLAQRRADWRKPKH